MNYYIICTDYDKADWLINAMINVCKKESSYKIEMRHNHTIVFYDGIDDNMIRFISIREAHKLKGKDFSDDFIITENDFREMWLLDYDFDISLEYAFQNYFGNTIISCDNCENISMTNKQQKSLNCIMPKVCAVYYEKIYHDTPLKRCEQEWYINYKERKDHERY